MLRYTRPDSETFREALARSGMTIETSFSIYAADQGTVGRVAAAGQIFVRNRLCCGNRFSGRLDR